MKLIAGNELTIRSGKISIIGLARLGQHDSFVNSCGLLSIPKHTIEGVYAGLATHSFTGKEMSTKIPVLVLCDNQTKQISVKTNTVTNAWLAKESYDSVSVQ
jgi:hypothetical protein